MKRTSVYLPDQLFAQLQHEAARHGTTVSEITRAAIEAYVGAGPRRDLQAAAAGRSGQHDISERIEEILRHEQT